jgi:hypothetical protein
VMTSAADKKRNHRSPTKYGWLIVAEQAFFNWWTQEWWRNPSLVSQGSLKLTENHSVLLAVNAGSGQRQLQVIGTE